MKTWKLSDIGVFLKNSFVAVLQGEFLLRLNIGKYFIHIVYIFFLFVLAIWTSLMIETSMAKMEKNNTIIKELEIEYSQKLYEEAEAGRRTNVEKTLELMGSQVKPAEKPATVIERR